MIPFIPLADIFSHGNCLCPDRGPVIVVPTWFPGPFADTDMDTALAALSNHFLLPLRLLLKMDKATLRDQAIKHRDQIDPREDNPEDAVSHFFKAISPEKGQVLAGYWPKGREFDPRPIMDEAMKAGLRCALPVVQKDTRILKFALWADNNPLEEGPYGIMQPAGDDFIDPDILLTPLLAFDRHGYRLGYGGGYYDATLADLEKRKSIKKIGVGYAQQAVLFNLPREEHDQPMDWIITPHAAINVNEAA